LNIRAAVKLIGARPGDHVEEQAAFCETAVPPPLVW